MSPAVSTPVADYLLEVGTEELPGSFCQSAQRELLERIPAALNEARLTYGDVTVWVTPRRISIVIAQLQSTQADWQELIKGPPASAAFDASGNPTQAALGFAKKWNVDPAKLTKRSIDGTDYVVLNQQHTGQTVFDVLPTILPPVILGVSGSHFMSWDTSDVRFSRPIRWLMSLYGKELLPFSIGLAEATQQTWGHRVFAKQAPIAINSVDDYSKQLLEQGLVTVNPDERRTQIWALLQATANELGGTVPPNDELLDLITMLVETPTVVWGRFDDRYLALPKEVIITVMALHQKYFPVVKADGSLMPYFMTVSNNPNKAAVETIRHGNEKVLRARLEDATFFYQEDCKVPLSHYATLLPSMMFQKGLGSMGDRAQRLASLGTTLVALAGLDASIIPHVKRAAELCKADLATQMVRELTELQGVVGRCYATLSGEPAEVASAIEAHYLPRFFGDAVATEPTGMILSLADKLDALIAVFAQKDARLPTGSKDPMGLRRMAMGLLTTLIENNSALNIQTALASAYDNLAQPGGPALQGQPKPETLALSEQFILQRFKGLLLDQAFAYDAVDSVFSGDHSPLSNVPRVLSLLSFFKEARQSAEFKAVNEAANRTAKMLGAQYQASATLADVTPAAFDDPTEKALFEVLTANPVTADATPQACWKAYQAWAPCIQAFFEAVQVNSPDAAVKANRYALLNVANQGFRQCADFTQWVD